MRAVSKNISIIFNFKDTNTRRTLFSKEQYLKNILALYSGYYGAYRRVEKNIFTLQRTNMGHAVA
jgi:hypothetical protein